MERKEQNRLSQQQFRQRKQQRLADLEAQLVSSAELIATLTEENVQLRQLVQSLSGFIGDGIASCLPRLGLDQSQFNQILEPPSTSDPRAGPSSERDGPLPTSSRPKKLPRISSSSSDPIREGPSPTFDGPTPAFHAEPPIDTGTIPREEDPPLYTNATNEPKLQAIQLISYHMRNKRQNPAYVLPPSLRPTNLQQSIPHEPIYDGIIFASLRDRLIVCRNQYDISTLLSDLVESLVIHEDDILQPSNWELSHAFLTKYWFVIEEDVLEICNKWRGERGEQRLNLRDLIPDGHDLKEGVLGKRRVK